MNVPHVTVMCKVAATDLKPVAEEDGLCVSLHFVQINAVSISLRLDANTRMWWLDRSIVHMTGITPAFLN